MKRTGWVILVLIIVLAVIVAVSRTLWPGAQKPSKKPTTAKNPSVIRIAEQPALCCVPYYIARNKGWLEKEFAKDGIKVKLTTFLAGPPMTESFARGDQDIGLVGETPPIIARSEGINIKVVASSLRGPGHVALVVPKDSPITSPKDLTGKKVAVAKGSNAHQLLFELLDRYGVDPAQVSLVPLLPPDGKAAFEKGDVDAWAVWTPWTEQVEVNGSGRLLADASGIKLGGMYVIANGDFAKKYPHLVKRFLNVLERAADCSEENLEEAQKLIAAQLKQSDEVVRRAWPRVTDWHPRLTRADIKDISKAALFLKEQGIIRNEINVEVNLIDKNILRRSR